MYRLKCLQGSELKEDYVFKNKKEVKNNLVDYHNMDYTGSIPLKKWTLDQILDYGSWELIKIKENK